MCLLINRKLRIRKIFLVFSSKSLITNYRTFLAHLLVLKFAILMFYACSKADSKYLWEELKEPDINVKEFDDLFSKIPLEKSKKTTTKAPVAKKKKEVGISFRLCLNSLWCWNSWKWCKYVHGNRHFMWQVLHSIKLLKAIHCNSDFKSHIVSYVKPCIVSYFESSVLHDLEICTGFCQILQCNECWNCLFIVRLGGGYRWEVL